MAPRLWIKKKRRKKNPAPKKAPEVQGSPNKAIADEIAMALDGNETQKKRAQQRIKLVFQKGNIPRENLHKTMRAAMAKWEDGKPAGFGFQSPLEAEEDLFVQASINILKWFGFGELEQRVDQYIEWHYQNNGDYDENMAPF